VFNYNIIEIKNLKSEKEKNSQATRENDLDMEKQEIK
jgi:hypothetical protein